MRRKGDGIVPKIKPDSQLTDADEAEIVRLAENDPDNLPLSDEQLSQMSSFDEAMRRFRGKGRKPPKQVVTLRLDPDVVEAFKADGPGWQSRVNAALREAKKLPERA
jgi:uncharacterized protein (DUF4415 family)